MMPSATRAIRPMHTPGEGVSRAAYVVAVCVLAYVIASLAQHSWDPMSFVIVGGAFDPTVPNDSLGYDGQFAYQIALRPLEAWRYVDVPAYRYQRILYPILARITSLGIPGLLPWTLIAINVVALPLGTATTARILARHGESQWYALTYGLYAGLLMPVRLDLTEPLAYLLVQAGVLALMRGRYRWSSIALALASLTREVTLLFALGVTLDLLCRRSWRRAVVWTSATFAPFALWQVALRMWFGEWGIGSGGALSTPFEWVPLRGWWQMAAHDFRAFALMSLYVLPLAVLPALLSLIVSGKHLIQDSGSPMTWILLANAAVILFLPTSNILDPLGLARITAGLLVAVLDFAASQRRKRTLNYALLWIATLPFLYQDGLLPRS